MKKIWLMLLVICSVCAFSACSDDDKIPVTIDEGGMPKITRVGETITITGEGFDATAKFALRNEAEKDVEMEATVKSDKEVSCIVPDVEAGVYKVILIQAGEWEIGTIEIISVKKVVVPETAEAESVVTITGEGFATTAKLALQKEEEEPMEVEATITPDKVTFKVPASFLGDYKVILIQDGEWNIGTITIIPPARELRVKQITLLQNGEIVSIYDFKYNEDNKIINFTETKEETPMSYDIEYSTGQINVSGENEFRFDLNDNGNIINTYLPNDGYWDWDTEEWIPEPGNVEWTYDEEGYLIKCGDDSYNYDENKDLTSVGYDAIYQYNNPTQKNNLYLVDPIALMTGFFYDMYQIDDLLPHILGICGNRSKNLPTDAFPLWVDNSSEIVYTNDETYPEYISKIEFRYVDDYSGPINYTIQFIYE